MPLPPAVNELAASRFTCPKTQRWESPDGLFFKKKKKAKTVIFWVRDKN